MKCITIADPQGIQVVRNTSQMNYIQIYNHFRWTNTWMPLNLCAEIIRNECHCQDSSSLVFDKYIIPIVSLYGWYGEDKGISNINDGFILPFSCGINAIACRSKLHSIIQASSETDSLPPGDWLLYTVSIWIWFAILKRSVVLYQQRTNWV